MGVDAYNRNSTKCVYCNNERLKCYGHFGKIDTPYPLLNPIMIRTLKKMLEALCFHCYALKADAKVLEEQVNLYRHYNMEELNIDLGAEFETDLTSPKIYVLDLLFKKCKENSKCPRCGQANLKIKLGGNFQLYHYDKKMSAPAQPSEYKKFYPNLISSFKVAHILAEAFAKNQETIGFIFNCDTVEDFVNVFTLKTIPVMPNRFRPDAGMKDEMFLNVFSGFLVEILKHSTEIKNILSKELKIAKKDFNTKILLNEKSVFTNEKFLKEYIDLQTKLNLYMDSSLTKEKGYDKKGIRQLLEKKEGIFRMKLMGKRVNYASRSVISPDPYLDTDQIGVPLFMAKRLSFPEDVNSINLSRMKKFVLNGSKWPGATAVVDFNGKRRQLDFSRKDELRTLAKDLEQSLGVNPKTVLRHLVDGDMIIFNRQPTLHKPSMMGFRIKVHKTQETVLRMHYANCATFNADFDGDEMNMHIPQNLQSKCEIATLMHSSKQYINGTKGEPLRGLIQDHVIGGVVLTSLDTFFEKEVFTNILYVSLQSAIAKGYLARIELPQPTIHFPKKLWTGKQIISTILLNIFPNGGKLNHAKKNKVPVSYFGVHVHESETKFCQGLLVHGVIDKNTFGNTPFGLIHAIHELYGAQYSELMLSCLSRLLTYFVQFHGHTCGVDDLILNPLMDAKRKAIQNKILFNGFKAPFDFAELTMNNESKTKKQIKKYAKNQDYKLEMPKDLQDIIENKKLNSESTYGELDTQYKKNTNDLGSELVKLCLDQGLSKQFPQNFFNLMVTTGAKGSNVNHSFISVQLGQQELEGKRVPEMPGGRTLPCFPAHCALPSAGGYVCSRFIDGLKPYEFYFHCMAGREGLIDTAIKTANSGYLQRCLIKGMENLTVQWDSTVRNDKSDIFQFLYGEDGLNPCDVSYLNDFDFSIKNVDNFYKIYKEKDIKDLIEKDSFKMIKKTSKAILEHFEKYSQINIQKMCDPTKFFGSVSQKYYSQIYNGIVKNKKNFNNEEYELIENMLYKKYHKALIQPGENVGTIAGQGVGEPSTQMTLNTFHLAGHGGVNVTLGIPRLREILMTDGTNIKTPIMRLVKREGVPVDKFVQLQQKLSSLTLYEVINHVKVTEAIKEESPGARSRFYHISLVLENLDKIYSNFDLTSDDIAKCVTLEFIPLLRGKIHKDSQKAEKGRVARQKSTVEINEDNATLEEELEELNIQDTKNEDNENTRKRVQDYQEDKDDHISTKSELEENNYIFENGDKAQLSFNKEKNSFSFDLFFPLEYKKIVIDSYIRDMLTKSYLRKIKNVGKSFYTKFEKSSGKSKITYETIVMSGCNLEAVFKYDDFFQMDGLYTNNINFIWATYGVEAARASIVKEITNVFDVYGIKIDHRHLFLISDYMTREGFIRAFNRKGMALNHSPIQRMSFETVIGYLRDSCLINDKESNKGISSNIVAGTLSRSGTGMVDLLMKV